MTMTYADVSGRITQPGTDTGLRVRITAAPETTNGTLRFPDDALITLGPQIVETDDEGSIPAGYQVPLDSDLGDAVIWRFTVEPLDNVPGLSKRWILGRLPITGDVTIDEITSTDVTAVTSDLRESVAENAAAVLAVVATNDGIMTAVAEDSESDFAGVLSATYASRSAVIAGDVVFGSPVVGADDVDVGYASMVSMLVDDEGSILDVLFYDDIDDVPEGTEASMVLDARGRIIFTRLVDAFTAERQLDNTTPEGAETPSGAQAKVNALASQVPRLDLLVEAGQIPVATDEGEWSPLPAPTESGQVLVADLTEPGKWKVGDAPTESVPARERALLPPDRSGNRFAPTDIPVMATPPTITNGAAGAGAMPTSAFDTGQPKAATGGPKLWSPVLPVFRLEGATVDTMLDTGGSYPGYYGTAWCTNGTGLAPPTGGTDATPNVVQFKSGWAMEFWHMDPANCFGIVMSQKAAGDNYSWRLFVDGEDAAGYIDGLGEGQRRETLIDFGAEPVRPRLIRVETYAQKIKGITTTQRGAIWHPTDRPRKPRALFIGDSKGLAFATVGTDGNTVWEAWPAVLCRIMGWECWNGHIGGTGFIAGNGSSNSTYVNRISDVTDNAPDIVIYSGPTNDWDSPKLAFLQAAATTCFEAVKAMENNPTLIFINTGAYHNGKDYTSNPKKVAHDAIRAACAAGGVDLLVESFSDTDPWIVGTGYENHETNDGFADWLLADDGTHWGNADAHTYIAWRAAQSISAAIDAGTITLPA